MKHDVSFLMMPMGSDRQNEFGKENARLPLLLPKVMEGRPTKSTSLLVCRLPPEILGNIMDLISDDKAALSALALVNSDCRQLARSCQFADVCFDYSPNSTRLLLQLMKEGMARAGHAPDPSNTTRPPFIGSCIRRVAVRPNAHWVAQMHGDLYDADFGDAASDISRERRDELSKKATDSYLETYRNPIQAVMKLAMPHLETLLLHDRLCLDGGFFRTVTNLPIRRLMLSGVRIGEADCLESSATPLVVPLESLFLRAFLCSNKQAHGSTPATDTDAGANVDTWENRNLRPFLGTLLRSCSTTLRRLTLRKVEFGRDPSVSFGAEDLFFPRLRYLDVSMKKSELDVRAWSSLFSAPLRHLRFSPRDSPAFKQALSACQTFRDLETLVISRINGKDKDMGTAQPVIDFISRHPHVLKLSIGSTTPQLLDSHLVPLLSDGRWSNLSSLSLAWGEPGLEAEPRTAIISAASLAAVGSIESLEQLHLTADQQGGWHPQWLIDHKAARRHLGGLAKLKRLAFSGDTYMLPGHVSDPDKVKRYYQDRLVSSVERNDALERPELGRVGGVEHMEAGEDIIHFPQDERIEIWECAHRNRMLRETEEYAAVFPHLEWVYCGQWLMEIRKKMTPEGMIRVAVPLTKKRGSSSRFLRQTFGMGGDE